MLVGLPTVAVLAILAELAGNSATRPTTRTIFALVFLLEVGLFGAMGGVATWVAHGVLSLT
jgi:hypothetical protein